MGKLVVVGLQDLRTLFGTYEQFVGRLCNVLKICNVRRTLWNGTLMSKTTVITCNVFYQYLTCQIFPMP